MQKPSPKPRPRKRVLEQVVQAKIVRKLRDDGHRVMVCGTRARGSTGFSPVTPGCPDLFVLPAATKQGNWIAIEIKTPRTRKHVRPAQKELLTSGCSSVATSYEEACQIVHEYGKDAKTNEIPTIGPARG